jgi:hypothetical protein
MQFYGANITQTQYGRTAIQPLKTLYVEMDSTNGSPPNPAAPIRISLNIRTLQCVPNSDPFRYSPSLLSDQSRSHYLRHPTLLVPRFQPHYYPPTTLQIPSSNPVQSKFLEGGYFGYQNGPAFHKPRVYAEYLDTSIPTRSNEVSLDSADSPALKPQRQIDLHRNENARLSIPAKNTKSYLCEDQTPNFPQYASLEDLSEPVNFSKLKHLMFQYFYAPDELALPAPLNTFEMRMFRIFLIKKLVHDKKKSKIFFAIRNLCDEELLQFLQTNPAVNRKNIIKSNIFKRAWKALEKKYRGDFSEHFFGDLIPNWPKDSFSIKHYRKTHCFNLADEFYTRCFVSDKFREEFFELLEDDEFREGVLRQSRQKFANCFDFWMTETIMFLQKAKTPLERHTKLPDYKYGMSAKDYEMAPSLFLRLLAKD